MVCGGIYSMENTIKRYGGVEVSAMEVYSDIFQLGTNQIQRCNEPSGQFKANPLGYMKQNDEQKGNYRIMFDDTFEDTLRELQESDFAIMNGLTYYGRKNLQSSASKMYALIVDLDGTNPDKLSNFLNGAFADEYKIYPLPNYLVLSGHGVHLYYVFDEPVALFPNIKIQLKELKYALTRKVWNMYTSTEKHVQFQGINQGFRIVGGKTKIDGVRARAFRLNRHPYTLEQLNQYVPESSRIDVNKLYKESKMSLSEAQKKYPEWYHKRVLEQQPKGTWKCKEDLYQWWIRQIKEGATYGHRYFCIMCLSIYAVKCGISKEQLERDSEELLPFMNTLNDTEPFTMSDIKSALECYDERYIRFPRNDISKLSAIEIKPNKRNGRTRQQHLRIVNATNQIKKELGEPIGRPSVEQIVNSYLNVNPDASVSKAAADLGLSRTTIYKYRKEVK